MRINSISIYNYTFPKIQVSNAFINNKTMYDTVTFSGKKDRKEKIGDYYKKDIVKRLTKKGCSDSIVDSILSNGRKKEHLAKFIKEYENGEIKFSRPPREREVCFAIDNDLSNEKLQLLMSYEDNRTQNEKRQSRSLKTKEVLYAIENNATAEETQRAIILSDRQKDGKTYLSVPLTFKEGLFIAQNNLDDKKAETYITLKKERVIDAMNIVSKDEKYQRFIYLINNPKLSRPLTINEAGYFVENNLSDEQIQRYIDLQNGDPTKSSEDKVQGVKEQEARIIVFHNFDNFQGYHYVRLRRETGQHFCSLVKEKENLKRLLKITNYYNEPDFLLSRPLTTKEGIQAIKSELDNDEINYFIKAIDSGVESYIAIDLIKNFFKYKDINSIEELSRKEKRELLKKIINKNTSVFDESRQENDFPLVPRNKEEYCSIVSSLAKSIGINIEPISDEKIKTFNEGIEELIKEIENKNIQNLKSLDKIFVGIKELKKPLEDEEDNRTLTFLKNIIKSKEFKKLSDKDKKILTIATLLHSINKNENNTADAEESAFDAYYITQKLNLPKEDHLKIYKIIKNQNWDSDLRNEIGKSFIEKAQDIAYDTRLKNTFAMIKILSMAKAKNTENNLSEIIENYIKEIKSTQIYLPQTKIPPADKIKNGKSLVKDGIKNTVLKINELDNDLSKYGFEEGTTKENLTALVHGFQEEGDLSNLDVFSIADNDAILSASLMDVNNYKVFRQQGFILDVHSSNIHAGYFKDFGSGLKKNVELITREYIFPSNDNQRRKIYRTYLSDLTKEKLNIDNKTYREIIEQVEDENSIFKIEKINPEFANAIKGIFNEMNCGQRKYNREYNEMLVSRPKIQGVFSYGQDFEDIPLFLRKYAQDNNLPILMFGN